MALFHLRMQPISRSGGRSAVAAAAYRAAETLTNERDGLVHDFSRRSGVEHTEIVLPENVSAAEAERDAAKAKAADAKAEWAKERSALWNAAEAAEKRKDGRVAREIEISLPHELTPEQRLALTREFAHGLADRYGVAVDIAIHSPHGETDIRNHHAHLLLTTRKVGPEGLGEKSDLELENRKLVALGLPTSHEQLRDIRIGWKQRTNQHLAKAGLDIRVDHRSHLERGLEIEPTQHMGVHATQMQRRGQNVSRTRLDEEAAQRNAILIREKPEQVLTLITGEKSVFDRRDVARVLHRYVDGADAFQAAFAKVMASPALVELRAEQRDDLGRVIEATRYSTREMVTIERDMAASADRMVAGKGSGIGLGIGAGGNFRVAGRHVAAAIAMQQGAGIRLDDEQRLAVQHVAGPERIAAVVGLAGAGKSTMLAAARQAWELQGYQVRGAALAGKAASGLEEAAGIPSRTLASWERGWERGFDQLTPRDVFVIDEAGMVGSKQLSRFITEADRTGAKIVLVGDPEQLQPIGAGAAFRAVAERIGFVELEAIRRQREPWQRAASVDLGRNRTAQGLAAYERHNAIHMEETGEVARQAIVRDATADMAARPEGSRLVLAHRRVDVQELNEAIRAVRQDRGELVDERVYRTSEGERSFAVGDRLLFRENNRDLGVKNGMLGTVELAEDGRLGVRLDSATAPGQGRAVSVSMEDYAAVDHGYATTIHKAQGATVDRAYVLASGSMDRHLTYVALTRHRDDVQLYAGRDEFYDVAALAGRLSRSQAKETTLDYDRAGYAQRRGIDSEIVVKLAEREVVREQPVLEQSAAKEKAADRQTQRSAETPVESQADTPAERQVETPTKALPDRQAETLPKAPARKPSMFDGLNLRSRPIRQPEADRPALEKAIQERQPLKREPSPIQRDAAGLDRAVGRYARAWSDADRMREQGLPVLEHQKIALADAGRSMEAARPGATRDLAAALEHEPATQRAMVEMQGRERVGQLVAGIQHEARVRQDPELKAERLVKVWNGLEVRHAGLNGWDDKKPRQAIEAQMKAVAGELKRDPQLEAVLRKRGPELGIDPGSRLDRVIREANIQRAIQQSVPRERDRFGLSM